MPSRNFGKRSLRKLRTCVMPPPNVPQPSGADRLAILTSLETSLDGASAAKLNPGRTDTLRRLNRTEYQNAIRDLLALDIDAASFLPADESGHGFDNVNVSDLSATLLNRYICRPEDKPPGSREHAILSAERHYSACLPISRRKISCLGCRLAREVVYRRPIRLRRTASTRFRSRSCAIWPESSADCAMAARMSAAAARPGAGPDFHGLSSDSRQRNAERTIFESAHPREGRPAQPRGHFRQSVPFQMRRAEVTSAAGNIADKGERWWKDNDVLKTKKGDSQTDVPEKRARCFLALPLLDAMIPAATARGQHAAKPVPGSASCSSR